MSLLIDCYCFKSVIPEVGRGGRNYIHSHPFQILIEVSPSFDAPQVYEWQEFFTSTVVKNLVIPPASRQPVAQITQIPAHIASENPSALFNPQPRFRARPDLRPGPARRRPAPHRPPRPCRPAGGRRWPRSGRTGCGGRRSGPTRPPSRTRAPR